MVISFTIDTLWGRTIFQKDIPDIHIPDVVLAIFNKRSQPISAELLISEEFLIESGVTKAQANTCVAFHNLLNAIPLIKDSDGSISRESRAAKGIFFPFSESELGEDSDNIKFHPLEWAATRESAEKWIEYLQEQGYLELGGNFTIEKINYPVLSGV